MNNNIKITYLLTGLGCGGCEKQVVELAKEFKSRGHKISVISITGPNFYLNELKDFGISVILLNMKKISLNVIPLIKYFSFLLKERPHILHSHMVHANLLARFTRMLIKIPVVICSARSSFEGGIFRKLLYRITDSLCDVTTNVSRYAAEIYVKNGMTSREKMRFIPNGIDTEKYKFDHNARAQVRGELKIADDFVWISVGNFVKAKNHKDMVTAFSKLHKTRPKTKLILAGAGKLRGSIVNLINNLKINDSVLLLGLRSDIPQLLSAGDAFVLPSLWEGFPNVLLEASSCELPIVSTDTGGINEIVMEGKTGFLALTNDPDELYHSMNRMTGLPESERKKMGEKKETERKIIFIIIL